jgi:hypothetical protein
MTHDIDPAEVAKLVRKELHTAFPATKFSVKTSRYSGGSSNEPAYPHDETIDRLHTENAALAKTVARLNDENTKLAGTNIRLAEQNSALMAALEKLVTQTENMASMLNSKRCPLYHIDALPHIRAARRLLSEEQEQK